MSNIGVMMRPHNYRPWLYSWPSEVHHYYIAIPQMAEATSWVRLVVCLTAWGWCTRSFTGRTNGGSKHSSFDAMVNVSRHWDTMHALWGRSSYWLGYWDLGGRNVFQVLHYVILPLRRIKDVKAQSLPVIDVDGGSLARKWCRLSQEGVDLEPLSIPQPPPRALVCLQM